MSDKYPECEKLKQAHSERIRIQNFLEWMSENGMEIATYTDESHHLRPVYKPHEEIILEYLGIDAHKLEIERRAMLEACEQQQRDYLENFAEPEY